MKKLLFSVLLACGLAVSAFAQQVPVTTLVFPVPASSDAFVFTAPDGHQVPYSIAFAANGLTYIVFDPSVSSADFASTFAYAQSAGANIETNGAKLVPLVVPGFVNTSIGVQNYRMTSAITLTSNAVLQTLPQLQATLQTNSNYMFRCILYVHTGAGGIKIDFGGTSVPQVNGVMAQVNAYGGPAVIFGSQITGFLTAPAGSATTGITQVVIEGTMQINTGGTFVIQWAQASSNGAQSIVEYGSTLTVTQIP